MSRRPRQSFAAPFILSIAVALPMATACKSGGGGGEVKQPDPDPVGNYGEWNVWMAADGSGCSAAPVDSGECPPDASCNPPPPMAVSCPEGISADGLKIIQAVEGGECATEAGAPVACPSWESDEEQVAPDEPIDPEPTDA